MSLALFVMLVPLGFSLGRTFVLQPSEKDFPSISETHAATTNKWHGQSLQSIKKTILGGLNLQMEPQLPSGGLTGIREQWKAVFSTISHTPQERAVPGVDSQGPTAVNITEQKCCQKASQIFLKDLGWENWVIYPESFTFIQCVPCNLQLNLSNTHSPAHSLNTRNTPLPMSCCQPTSQELLPFLYMDEQRSLVISSVQMTSLCGCGPGNQPFPSKD
ncbi:bone morphogenetic protein 4-like [Osmerus mordax]|uniref:bone morphogenetic protein 4-like n=1 Tax=Osmerus mordax TaxID=8014 RepID=UPI003510B732